MIHLIPISKTLVAWDDYFGIIKETTGESASRGIDEKKILVSKQPGLAYTETLKDILESETKALKHIHYGFLVLAVRIFFHDLLQRRDEISVSLIETTHPDYDLGIISGTLLQFKNLILGLDSPQEMRMFVNKLQQYFEVTENLYLFDGFSKRSMNDGTYKLIKYENR